MVLASVCNTRMWWGPRWLSGLTAHLPPRRTGFNPWPVHSEFPQVGIVADDTVRRFLGDLPFPPPFHSGVAPYFPHVTLIDSQDLDLVYVGTHPLPFKLQQPQHLACGLSAPATCGGPSEKIPGARSLCQSTHCSSDLPSCRLPEPWCMPTEIIGTVCVCIHHVACLNTSKEGKRFVVGWSVKPEECRGNSMLARSGFDRLDPVRWCVGRGGRWSGAHGERQWGLSSQRGEGTGEVSAAVAAAPPGMQQALEGNGIDGRHTHGLESEHRDIFLYTCRGAMVPTEHGWVQIPWARLGGESQRQKLTSVVVLWGWLTSPGTHRS
ncbi:hypothetical protein PR048_000574 [Dryococelus australis]|uniref:Uncharacterized protein n=1 Tax=Dryococelus australis TaxID=614101 RepID=A0ABQ9IF10_9NEOP|nr:hypothetical protein PR048_000574 [Dryococelus australis]